MKDDDIYHIPYSFRDIPYAEAQVISFLTSYHSLEKSLSKKAQAAAKEGMKMIERGTCLRFRERTTESDYLDFYYGEILKNMK